MALQYESYHVGTLLRLQAVFQNAAGVTIDPDTVAIYVTSPDGVVTEYTYGDGGPVFREAIGTYFLDFDVPNQPGIWYWAARSTGTGQAAAERRFDVIKPRSILVVQED